MQIKSLSEAISAHVTYEMIDDETRLYTINIKNADDTDPINVIATRTCADDGSYIANVFDNRNALDVWSSEQGSHYLDEVTFKDTADKAAHYFGLSLSEKDGILHTTTSYTDAAINDAVVRVASCASHILTTLRLIRDLGLTYANDLEADEPEPTFRPTWHSAPGLRL